jgi:hypothetical protein
MFARTHGPGAATAKNAKSAVGTCQLDRLVQGAYNPVSREYSDAYVPFCSAWHPHPRRTVPFRNANSANKSGEVIGGRLPAFAVASQRRQEGRSERRNLEFGQLDLLKKE